MDLTFIPNRIAWSVLFLGFVIVIINQLPDGIAYSNDIVVAFYNAGVYLQKANLFFPVSTMLTLLVLSLGIFGVLLIIKITFWIINLVRSNGGNM